MKTVLTSIIFDLMFAGIGYYIGCIRSDKLWEKLISKRLDELADLGDQRLRKRLGMNGECIRSGCFFDQLENSK